MLTPRIHRGQNRSRKTFSQGVSAALLFLVSTGITGNVLAEMCLVKNELAFKFNEDPFDHTVILENQTRLQSIFEDYDSYLDLRNSALQTIALRESTEIAEEAELADKVSFRTVLSDVEADAVALKPVDALVPALDIVVLSDTVDRVVTTFEDPNATDLDRADALLGWIPILGNIMDYFVNAEKKKAAADKAETERERIERERRLFAATQREALRAAHAKKVGEHARSLYLSHQAPDYEVQTVSEYFDYIKTRRQAYVASLKSHWVEATNELQEAYVEQLYKQMTNASIAHADYFVAKRDLDGLAKTIYARLSKSCDYDDYECSFNAVQELLNDDHSVRTLVQVYKPYHAHMMANMKLPVLDAYFTHQKAVNKGYRSALETQLSKVHTVFSQELIVLAGKAWRAANNRDEQGKSTLPQCTVHQGLDAVTGTWVTRSGYLTRRGFVDYERPNPYWAAVRSYYDYQNCGVYLYDASKDSLLQTKLGELRKLFLLEGAAAQGKNGLIFEQQLLAHPAKVAESGINIAALKDLRVDAEKTLRARAYWYVLEHFLVQHKAAYKPTWYHAGGVGVDTWVSKDADGEVQCLGFDGASCAWGEYRRWQINDYPGFLGYVRPLTCGEQHKTKFGSTGYQDALGIDAPTHWCSVVRDRFDAVVANNKAVWHKGKVVGLNGWFTKDINGDIQCYSDDGGQSCRWGDYDIADESDLPGMRQHLTCGADHEAKYGTTGYQDFYGNFDFFHWCYVAHTHYATLATNQQPVWSDGRKFGANTWVSVNADGDAQCITSNSGLACAWGDYDSLRSLSVPLKRPLVCGQDHLNKFGSTGYQDAQGTENPTHWCSTVRAGIVGAEDSDDG